jgi:hypothetical protein
MSEILTSFITSLDMLSSSESSPSSSELDSNSEELEANDGEATDLGDAPSVDAVRTFESFDFESVADFLTFGARTLGVDLAGAALSAAPKG